VHAGFIHRLFVAAAVAAGLFLTAFGSAAEDVVEIRLRGRYFTDPATVRITIAVAPNSENRALRIEADGDRLYRSSEVALDGEHGRRIHTVEFKNLPAGFYTIRAAVLSTGEVRGAAEQFLVVGDPGEQ